MTTLHPDLDYVLNRFENKEEFENFFLHNRKVFDILKEVIDINISKRETNTSTSLYDSPSWAYAQADRIGEIRMLKYFKSFIS